MLALVSAGHKSVVNMEVLQMQSISVLFISVSVATDKQCLSGQDIICLWDSFTGSRTPVSVWDLCVVQAALVDDWWGVIHNRSSRKHDPQSNLTKEMKDLHKENLEPLKNISQGQHYKIERLPMLMYW